MKYLVLSIWIIFFSCNQKEQSIKSSISESPIKKKNWEFVVNRYSDSSSNVQIHNTYFIQGLNKTYTVLPVVKVIEQNFEKKNTDISLQVYSYFPIYKQNVFLNFFKPSNKDTSEMTDRFLEFDRKNLENNRIDLYTYDFETSRLIFLNKIDTLKCIIDITPIISFYKRSNMNDNKNYMLIFSSNFNDKSNNYLSLASKNLYPKTFDSFSFFSPRCFSDTIILTKEKLRSNGCLDILLAPNYPF
jgi:hypothetical protein